MTMDTRVSSISQEELLIELLNKKEVKILLNEYETIYNILSAPIEEVKSILKINESKAAKLEIIFELIRRGVVKSNNQSGQITDRINQLAAEYKYETREHVICLFLDLKSEIIAERTLSYGGLDGAYIDLPYMYRMTIRLNADRLILIHNHPDGSCYASEADKRLTTTVKQSLHVLNIRLDGSYILADGKICEVQSN